jgi:16S rRNA U516 pseudouridylate synthase RsuA-like enzyme
MSGHELPDNWQDPSYPICPGCDNESDDGWCSDCECFAHEIVEIALPERKPETVRQIMERLGEPYSELKRTGTGGWL